MAVLSLASGDDQHAIQWLWLVSLSGHALLRSNTAVLVLCRNEHRNFSGSRWLGRLKELNMWVMQNAASGLITETRLAAPAPAG